ncbi:hypothetical protein BH11PSE12_BH11PSE12_06490 [soil metagenome]
MKSLKNKFFIGFAAVAMTAAAGVYAQSGAGMGAGYMDGAGMHGERGMDHAKNLEKMQAVRAKHLTELHAKLKLTAAQEPAWKSFTDATAVSTMPTPPDRQAMEKLTTPERMEKMLERSKEHQSTMQNHLAALKTFYAALTPEQQKMFDESHRGMGRKGMQHRRMHDGAKTEK